MKNKLFLLVSLPLVLLATACGHNDDQPATTVNGVGSNVQCGAGYQNYNNQCVPTQYGNPSGQPGYNGGVNTGVPPGYTGSCGGQYWANGYSYTNNCWQPYSYGYTRWYYWGGVIWYW